MYQPANGDTVTVTRTMPNGRVWSCTGILSRVLTAAASPSGKGGFQLTGTDCTGQAYDSYLSDAASLKQYGVTQAVTLAKAQP